RLAIDRPRNRAAAGRGAGKAEAPQAAATQWESVPAATTVRIDPREAGPIAAPNLQRAAQVPKRTAQVSEFPVFGARRGPARFALVGGALAVLAVVTWFFMRGAPVSENVSAVVSAAAPKPGSVIRDC